MGGFGEFAFLLFDTQSGKNKNEKQVDTFHAFV